MLGRRFFIGLAMAFLLVSSAAAETLRGRVVAVADGDTLTLLVDEARRVRVRLSNIDAPERAQPYGDRARQELARLAFGKGAEVEVEDVDRYGRTVGRVRAEGVEVNAALVSLGAAWVYRQYNRDPALPALEEEARAAGRGLWALPEAERLPPWEWRAAQARERAARRAAGVSPAP